MFFGKLLIAAAAAAIATTAAAQTVGTEEHANEVTLNFTGLGVTGATFGGFVEITEGQPLNVPPTIVQSGSGDTVTLDVTLEAGRSASGQTAVDFTSDSGGAGFVWSKGSVFDDTPGGLNFFFSLNVASTLENFTVYLGQGSNLFGNNWWIGSPNLSQMQSSGGPVALLTLNDLKFVVSAPAFNFNTFDIAQAPSLTVPEPSTWALLTIGFGGLAAGALGRRLRSALQTAV
jgi:hypothetical protein